MTHTITTTVHTKKTVMDTVVCDGCGSILDMNLDIKDRKTRFKPSQVKTTGSYFEVEHYDRCVDDWTHRHFCPKCMHAWIDNCCESDEDGTEYDTTVHIGQVVPEEPTIQEEHKENSNPTPSTDDTEIVSETERILHEEDEMLRSLLHKGIS